MPYGPSRKKRKKIPGKVKDKLYSIEEALVLAKKMPEAKKLLPEIYQALDKAAKVGVIKKNNASRRKSRLTKLIDKKQ